MFKFPALVVVLILHSFIAIAKQDSLQVIIHNDKWVVKHDAKLGETVFSLARKYHVPPAVLADVNEVNYQSGLDAGRDIYIPLGAYNQVTSNPVNTNVRPLYYIVDEVDNLYRISKYAGVQQRTMQEWNHLSDNAIREGQRLFVGWILYDATDITNSSPLQAGKPATVIKKSPAPTQAGIEDNSDENDTVIIIRKPVADSVSPAEKAFLLQTNNGLSVNEEKGTAVFFNMSKKIAGSKTIYAFHNTARKGTIIKIYNPGTNTTVFAKVLGPIPGTKQYHDAIIGIDDSAQKMLGVDDARMWCELQYGY